MMNFTVYSKPGCSYCVKAKQLLESKNMSYSEVIVDVGQQKEEGKEYISVADLRSKIPGVNSVPQIFMDGTHIGGFESLRNKLETM